MSKDKIHSVITNFCLWGIALTLPLAINLNSYFIVLLVANWIAEGDFKKKLHLFFSNQLAVSFVLFFIVYLVGLLYSENIKFGVFNISKKLSFIALPFAISTIALGGKQIKTILNCFIFSCLVAAIICLSNAFQIYLRTGSKENFYYHQLSSVINIHAVYFSFYLLFSSVILIWQFFFETITKNKYFKLVALFIITLFLTTVYLLASKLFLVLTILTLLLLIFEWYRRNKMILKGLLLGVVFTVASLAVIFYSDYNRNRMKEIVNTNWDIFNQKKFNYDTPFTGASLRLELNKLALEIIDENNSWIWGSGTGDGQDLLNEKIKEYNLYTGNPKLKTIGYLGYNTHSQYVETFLYSGLIGLSILLYIIYQSLQLAVKKRDVIYIFFMSAFCIFFITESALELHKGIVFFVFFNCIFFTHLQKQNL